MNLSNPLIDGLLPLEDIDLAIACANRDIAVLRGLRRLLREREAFQRAERTLKLDTAGSFDAELTRP